MNYERARQRGDNGKWNWTSMNDRVVYGAFPCTLDPAKSCDHDTQEEAERHFHEASIEAVQFWPVVQSALVKSIELCRYRDCREPVTVIARWPDGYRRDELCEAHGTRACLAEMYPFEPGIESIHS